MLSHHSTDHMKLSNYSSIKRHVKKYIEVLYQTVKKYVEVLYQTAWKCPMLSSSHYKHKMWRYTADEESVKRIRDFS